MLLNYEGFLAYLKSKGYSTYTLRKQKLLSEGSLQRIRRGVAVNDRTLDALCAALGVSQADLLAAASRTFTIIAGVNGSGKSSLTGSLKYERKDLGTIVDVDQLTRAYRNDFYVAGQAAIAIMEDCISSGQNFTQETTLAGAYTRRVAKAAKSAGYKIRMYYVGIHSEEEALRRIENRVRNGGHNIPAEDVHRRWRNRVSAFQKICPYCDEIVFFDNGNGFVEVGQIQDGSFLDSLAPAPKWLRELLCGIAKPTT